MPYTNKKQIQIFHSDRYLETHTNEFLLQYIPVQIFK